MAPMIVHLPNLLLTPYEGVGEIIGERRAPMVELVVLPQHVERRRGLRVDGRGAVERYRHQVADRLCSPCILARPI